MSKLGVNAFSLSIDGYGAGPGQDLEIRSEPLGGLNIPALGYECAGKTDGARATHAILRKRSE